MRDATQGVVDARSCLAQAPGLDPAATCVKREFIGGGFGGTGWGWPPSYDRPISGSMKGRAGSAGPFVPAWPQAPIEEPASEPPTTSPFTAETTAQRVCMVEDAGNTADACRF